MTKPLDIHCYSAKRWLKNRGWSLAPLTGQDYPALDAIAHCWMMFFRSDETGRRCAINAAASLLAGCQEVAWPMARELIAHAGDWGHRAEVWPRVVEAYRQHTGATRAAERMAACHLGMPQVAP